MRYLNRIAAVAVLLSASAMSNAQEFVVRDYIACSTRASIAVLRVNATPESNAQAKTLIKQDAIQDHLDGMAVSIAKVAKWTPTETEKFLAGICYQHANQR